MVETCLGSGLLMDSSGKEVPVSHTAQFDLTCLYFSAHWCPPCRVMTPKLVKIYSEKWMARNKICVIFISYDRDEETMMEYFEEMPWLAIPFNQQERRAQVGDKFQVYAIPMVVILKKNGEVVTAEGYHDLLTMGEGALDSWLDNAQPKKEPPAAAEPPAAEQSPPAGDNAPPEQPPPEQPSEPEKPALAAEESRA